MLLLLFSSFSYDVYSRIYFSFDFIKLWFCLFVSFTHFGLYYIHSVIYTVFFCDFFLSLWMIFVFYAFIKKKYWRFTLF